MKETRVSEGDKSSSKILLAQVNNSRLLSVLEA